MTKDFVALSIQRRQIAHLSMGHSKRNEDQLFSRTCSSLIRRER